MAEEKISHHHSSSSSFSSIHLSDTSEVQKVFDRFDTNGDGLISASELSGVLHALGSVTTQQELDQMMSEMDTDKDGVVSLAEFAEFCSRSTGESDSESRELRDAFQMYDQDKNGLISASELHLVLSRLGENCTVGDCEVMIKSVDKDGDGNVSFDEFRKMMTRGAPKSS